MDETTQSVVTIVLAIIATLGGKEVWGYLKKKLDVKAKLSMHGNAGETELRNEIRLMLEGQIAELKGQVGALTERITGMEAEREADKKRIANQEIKIALLSERLVSKFTSTGRDLDNDTDLKIEDND